MPRRRPDSVLSALGIGEEDERRYQQVLPMSGSPASQVASALGVAVDALPDALAGLVDPGIVVLTDGRVDVLRTPEVITAAVSRAAASAARTRKRLEDLALAVPFMVAESSGPRREDVDDLGPIDGVVSTGGNPLALLTALIESSKGDLLFLRPDTWQEQREAAMAKVVGRAVASGRRSRAVYPLRVLHEAQDMLKSRVEEGEEVRLIDDLPTRLFVITGTHVIVPEPLGFADEPRLLVRQGAIVEALTLLFELYWQRAVPVSELSGARSEERTFLVRQLASGAKDEQIARTMGLSLRTVRRRVAELMIELGVDTRFQAGAEAAKRGWL